jgi:hypothetical protein
MSIYRLMSWANSGSNSKSEGEINRLVADVINAEDFKVEDLASFSAHRENHIFDESEKTGPNNGAPWLKDGWSESTVDIEIPAGIKNALPRTFSVPGLHHRSIVEVIRAAFAEVTALQFHLTPFKRFRTTATGEERVYDEVCASDAWLEAHNALQKSPQEAGCKLERVIAGLMWWSDSTHLANFGTAKVWPLYLYFANLSKYIRARPNSGACHHIAYFPSVCPCPPLRSLIINMHLASRHYQRFYFDVCNREDSQSLAADPLPP